MSEILETYWAPHFGNTDEATALVSYLAQASGDPIEVHTLFGDLGLDGLSGNYTDTEIDGYGDAFLLVAALSVLMAENKASGGVNLGELGGADKSIRLHIESKENTQINTALKYFASNSCGPVLMKEDRFDEDDLSELANLSEELRGQLD